MPYPVDRINFSTASQAHDPDSLRRPLHQLKDYSLVPDASGEGPLSQTIDGPVLATAKPKRSAALVEGGKNHGIKTPYNHGKDVYFNILSVHGLTGNAYNTWLDKETGIHWPSKLLGKDISESSILSFGYNADVVNIWVWEPALSSRLSDLAKNLVGKRVRERERSDTEIRRIIFIAHSLGGLVTKQALTHPKNSAQTHFN